MTPLPDRSDWAALSLADLYAMFLSGALTPTDYLEFCLARIEARNPVVHAVLDIFEGEARAAARLASRRYADKNPLSAVDGIPIAVKANIAVKGRACHGGIKAYAQDIADEDAACVARLRAAGAIILCSVNMEEGALGAVTDNPFFGRTTNPLNAAYTAGGSSGGSAAVVAAGMVPVALGTDTMGSVRIPSAYCGLVGHKPSYAAVPFDGIMALSPTLDHVGPHSRSVDDARRVLSVMTGGAGLSSDANLTGHSIGYLNGPEYMEVMPEIAEAFSDIMSKLKSMGVSTQAVTFEGYDFGKARRAGLLISEVEGHAIHADKLVTDPDGFSDHFRGLLEWGAAQPSEKVVAAHALIAAQALRAETLFQACDVLLMPTAPQVAFKFDDPIPASQADFTAFANFAGLPATAIPIGQTPEGLPMSLQVIGPTGADALTLVIAEQIAKLT